MIELSGPCGRAEGRLMRALREREREAVARALAARAGAGASRCEEDVVQPAAQPEEALDEGGIGPATKAHQKRQLRALARPHSPQLAVCARSPPARLRDGREGEGGTPAR